MAAAGRGGVLVRRLSATSRRSCFPARSEPRQTSPTRSPRPVAGVRTFDPSATVAVPLAALDRVALLYLAWEEVSIPRGHARPSAIVLGTHIGYGLSHSPLIVDKRAGDGRLHRQGAPLDRFDRLTAGKLRTGGPRATGPRPRRLAAGYLCMKWATRSCSEARPVAAIARRDAGVRRDPGDWTERGNRPGKRGGFTRSLRLHGRCRISRSWDASFSVPIRQRDHLSLLPSLDEFRNYANLPITTASVLIWRVMEARKARSHIA